ncbi:MAG: CDGSH iron-sulfur domain-containing protein [Armatimonadetes bacterium]|nr:CDGSH iron-sulfur domain-containing protein [Armatimonadota bacterium]
MSEVTISFRDNGPILVKGPATVVDAEGKKWLIEKETFFLCRCGASNNKPFCDAAHRTINFQSTERAPG